MIKKLSAVLVLVLFTLTCFGADYFVKPSSSGNGSGLDWNNAWSGFSGIKQSSLFPGDTVYIAGGNYAGGFTPTVNGSAANWITLKRVLSSDTVATSAAGWNNSFDSQIVMGGITFTVVHKGEYFIYDGRIENGWKIVVPNNGSAGVNWPNVSADHMKFRYLEVAGPAGATAWTFGGDLRGFDLTAWGGSSWQPINDITISYCNVHGLVDILYFANVHNSTVEYCKLYDCWAANSATYHENVLLTLISTDITFRYNQIWNWATEGIEMGYKHSNWYIYGNVWKAGAAGPYRRALETQYQGSDNIYVYNNVFDGLWLCIYNDNSGGGWTGCELKNNIFLNSPLGNIGGSWAQAANVTDPPTSSFVNSANRDYHLTSSATTLIDRGVALSANYNKDMDNKLRGAGNGWDIGPFEYNGIYVPPTNPPPIVITNPPPVVTNPPPVVTNISSLVIGNKVKLSSDLRVRSVAGISDATVVGSQPINSLGTLLSGPTSLDGYVWWGVNYDTGVDGFSIEKSLDGVNVFFAKYVAPTNVPPAGCTNYVYITNTVTVPVDRWFTNTITKYMTNSVDRWFTNTVTVNNYITNKDYSFVVQGVTSEVVNPNSPTSIVNLRLILTK